MPDGEGIEATVGARRGAAAGRGKPLSQRLMLMLTREVAGLERLFRREAREAGEGAGVSGMALKVRVDAVGNLTRTLEKLLDLARVETQAVRSEAEEGTEAERLRAELMRRLRAIDARRASGRRLFDADIAGGLEGALA